MFTGCHRILNFIRENVFRIQKNIYLYNEIVTIKLNFCNVAKSLKELLDLRSFIFLL